MSRLIIYTFTISLIIFSGSNTSRLYAGDTGFEGLFLGENQSAILVSYFDIANGNSYVQVTNTSSTNPSTIHVQIFADLNGCEDRNFTDSLTPNETHVYNISNLESANGNPINFQIPASSEGFVVISQNIFLPGGPVASIIGNFRIVRDAGYEYRVNSAASNTGDGITLRENRVARFSNNWGANQSDVVGGRFVADIEALADGTRDMTVQITDPYELTIFNDEETGISCGQAQFGCDEFPGDDDDVGFGPRGDGIDFPIFTAEFINQGINDLFPNTRGGSLLCDGNLDTDGFINLAASTQTSIFEELVGFVGLNDGSGRGSMDRFKYSGPVFIP